MASGKTYTVKNAGQEEIVQDFDDIGRGSGTNADQYEFNTQMTQLEIPSVIKVLEQLQTILPMVDKSKEELNQVFGRQNRNSARSVGDERLSQKQYDSLLQQLHEKDNFIKTLENKQREDRAKSEEVTKLQRKNTELYQRIQDLETEKETAKRDIDKLSRENTSLSEESAQKKKALESELEETKTRLSKMIGDKITDGNPDIANLSDENRPTKIAEKYSELYDNEWTDAFEAFEELGDEKRITSYLLFILLSIKEQCDIFSERNSENIIKAVYSTEQAPLSVPQEVKKQIKDMRKVAAPFITDQVLQEVLKYLNYKLRNSRLFGFINDKAVQAYIKKCTDVCWLMVVQDPPLYFGPDVKVSVEFDKSRFKEYTRSGSRVEYLVWPDLYLKEGSRLCKGVAQGYGDPSGKAKNVRARPESAPASRPYVSSPPVSQDIDRTTRPASANTFYQPNVRYTDQIVSSNDRNYDQNTSSSYRHTDKSCMSRSVFTPTSATRFQQTANTDRISRDDFYNYPPESVDQKRWYQFLVDVQKFDYRSSSFEIIYGDDYYPLRKHYEALLRRTT